MRMTIKEIAEYAGVSRGTVDRVLHNRYGVDPYVRSNVQRILDEIGFKPNAVAKALKQSEKTMIFGYVITDIRNPFWNGIVSGFSKAEKEYEAYGVKLKRIDMNEISDVEQVRCLNELIQGDEKMSGIFIGGINSPLISDYINTIADNIPIITYNTDIKGSKRLCFVGQNHLEAGHVAGRLMSLLMQRDGKIAAFVSTSKTLAHIERLKGFRESIDKLRPNSEVINPIRYIETNEAGYQAAVTALKDPDISALYVTGEGSVGVAQALLESGKRPGVKMICYDMVDGIVDAVRKEIIDITIGQNEYIQGYMPVKLMYEYLTFGTLPPNDTIYTDIDIRVKENIDYANRF